MIIITIIIIIILIIIIIIVIIIVVLIIIMARIRTITTIIITTRIEPESNVPYLVVALLAALHRIRSSNLWALQGLQLQPAGST
jgi:hypothetical protein